MQLKGAKIFITGAQSGVGLATAKLLHAKGAHLFLTGLDEAKLSDLAKELDVSYQAHDLRDLDGIPSLVSKAIQALKGIDVLINNAGYAYTKPMEAFDKSDIDHLFAVNTFAPALLAKEIVPVFKEQKSGNIINVGATGGYYGFKGGSIYGASKAALTEMTKCWAAELRPFNIRVMQVDPSWISGTTNNNGKLIPEDKNQLSPTEIAHVIESMLAMDNRGFIPFASVWATNPMK